MTDQSLRDFIGRLERKGDLVRVREPVSTVLEMTEIQTRLLAECGPAVLFENPVNADGSSASMPVLVNLFGTVERVAMGMDRTPQELRSVGEMLAFLRQPEPPGGFRDALDKLPLLKTVMAMRPKTVGYGPVQDVIQTGEQVDLTQLPVQTCWPGEPAPLITWPLVVTKGPSSAKEDDFNLGIYRMQLLDRNRTIMRWLKHRGGAQHHRRWAAEKPEPLPAAVVIGADPGTILAAVTPVPDTLSEYQFAGLLRGRKVDLVDCQTVPLKVPAHAEIVLEGHVSLEDYADEGPYGDHTGYYNAVEKFPVFTVSRDPAQGPDLSLHLHRTPTGRAFRAGGGAERCLRAAAGPAVPGGRGFLAAAGGLFLPHRRGLDEEGLSGPCQAGDAGCLVLPAAVHVHQVGDRRG